MRFVPALAAIAVLAAPLAAPAPVAAASLDAAIAGAHRSPANVARDKHRHPKETLTFFGLKPTMTVVEVIPGGGGWYTEILAPVLRDEGRLIVTVPSAPGKPAPAARTRFEDKLKATPAVYDKVATVPFGPGNPEPLAPAGSADLVVTFRNIHNLVGMGEFAGTSFKAMYDALKPGGVLGIVEHRVPENRSYDPKSGYMKESEVIALATAAGFQLDARSEVNANKKDTANWPKGVWTLPPNYAEGPETKAKYDAIGESDRMTLRFRKPR